MPDIAAQGVRGGATSAERFLALSPDARHIYRHLLACWLTTGECRWSRRDIHQDMKGAARFRHLAGLAGPLAELVAAGLLARTEAEPRLGIRTPRYTLLEPVLLRGQRPPSRFAGVLAPPLPPFTPNAAPAPAHATTSEATAWRVAALRRRLGRDGRLDAFQVRAGGGGAGRCHCCGEPLGAHDERHCAPCLAALRVVLATSAPASRG